MDGSCLGIIALVLLVVAVVAWRIHVRNQAADAVETARREYHLALTKLKADPRSADLRERTLALGRIYSAQSRTNKAVTLYDEMALMNDINAATASPAPTPAAAAPLPVSPAAPVASTAPSIEQRLAQLDQLRDKGIVTGEEYDERRRKILDQL